MSNSTDLINSLLRDEIELAVKLINDGYPIDAQNDFGISALHIACEKKLFSIVQKLLEAKANPNIRNTYDEREIEPLTEQNVPNTPSHISIDVIEELRALGSRTPLHIAAKNGSLDIGELLLEFGAFVDIQDSGGCTALHWASMANDINFIKLLLKYNANVNIQDIAGSTPLHEAIRRQKLAATEILLSQEAKVNLPDIMNQTALELAKNNVGFLNLVLKYVNEPVQDITKH